MSELESKIEQLAECIVVDTPFEDLNQLKGLILNGWTLCWAYNKEDFRLKIWSREKDEHISRSHRVVARDASAQGYINTMHGITYTKNGASEEDQLVALKLYRVLLNW